MSTRFHRIRACTVKLAEKQPVAGLEDYEKNLESIVVEVSRL